MKRFTRRSLFLLLTAALCLLLAGCWGSDPLAEENGDLNGLLGLEGSDTADDVVPITSFALPILAGETLDPIDCGDGVQQLLLPLLYEGLFELDPSFEPQPVLCESYTHSEDFTVWTFQVRSISFSDGSALSAADVAAALQRAKTSARYGARLSSVSSIRVQNGAVEITLSQPNNRFPALLDIPIPSKSSAGSAVPIGTGPYVYTTGDNGASLMKNTAWWKGESLPVDTIPLRTVDSENTLTYLFSSHAIQMLLTDYTGSDPVSYKGNLSTTDTQTTTLQYLGFNCRSGPFSDAKLRRAISLGINRDSICKAYLSGHAVSTQFPVAPASSWYPAALEESYNAESFAQAMTEAGYNGGAHAASVRMLVCEGNAFRLSAAKAIAAALSVYDLKVEVHTLPYEEYLSALQSGTFDLYYGETRMTPDFNCAALIQTGGSLNYGGFSDPALDAQLTTAFSTAASPSGANETLFSTFQTNAPIAPICFKTQSVVLQAGAADNITPTASNAFYRFPDWIIHLTGADS